MTEPAVLKCASCGAQIQVTRDTDHLACAHCGAVLVVSRDGGLVSLAPVLDQIGNAPSGGDKAASERAIQRLTDEIAGLEVAKQQISRQIPPATYVVVIVAMLICVGGAYFGIQLEEARWFAIIAPVIAVVLLITMMIEPLEKQERYAAIEREIATKREEIQRHQELLSR